MALDWLYGPRTRYDIGGFDTRFFRAVVIEKDVVADLIRMFRLAAPDDTVLDYQFLHSGSDRNEIVRVADGDVAVREQLARFSNTDLQGLHLIGSSPSDPSVHFALNVAEGTTPEMRVTVKGELQTDQYVDVILRSGRPRIRGRALIRFVPVLFALGLVATWVWFMLTEAPPISLAVSGSGLTLAVVAAAMYVARTIGERMRHQSPGVRFINLSRNELRLDRANSHRDLRVAAVSVLATAALAVLTTVAIDVFSAAP